MTTHDTSLADLIPRLAACRPVVQAFVVQIDDTIPDDRTIFRFSVDGKDIRLTAKQIRTAWAAVSRVDLPAYDQQ